MSKKYISNDDYVQAEYVIYNDLNEDIFSSIPEVHHVVDKDWIKENLFKGEEWVHVEGCPGYVITNMGRAFSMRKYKQLSPHLSTQSVHLFICKEKIDFPGMFADKGWTFDIEVIRNNYKKYKWAYRESKQTYVLAKES